MATSVLITGMHRSGTSLAANLASRLGVPMGQRLMGPGKGNSHGHFEDLDFFELHETVLAARGSSPLAPPDGELVPTPAEAAAAEALVAARQGLPVWGFKDPRAALLLPFWDARLPDPVYLFVYRHPVEVTLSLLRRGLDLEVLENPRIALSAWVAYNEHIVRFLEDHRDRCLLWHGGAVVRSPLACAAELAERLGLPAPAAEGAKWVEERDFQAGLWAREIAWEGLIPAAMALYRELEALADLPRGDDEETEPEPGERQAREAAERLLAVTLRSPLRPARPPIEHEERARFSDLQQSVAQAEERIRRLEGERDDLAGRLAELAEVHDRLVSTWAVRAARVYWEASRKVRRWLGREAQG